MTVSVRGVGARLRAPRPEGSSVPHGVRRGYGVLASSVLGVLLLAVIGALMGPSWSPAPVTDPILVQTASTAITGAPALGHYRTRATVVTVQLAATTVKARIVEPVGAPTPRPGVVFVHGAGTGQFTGAFVDQAERLAEDGIVTMVPDKNLQNYSTRNRDYVAMAADYERSVDLLRHWPGVDPDAVGVYAESEGGWIAPIMAVKDPRLAFVALVSAPVVPPRQQVAFAIDNYLRNTGVPGGVFRAIPRAAGMSLPGGGFDYVDFDVRPYVRQVTQPIFVAYGTADASMPVIQGAQQILADTAASGNHAVTVRYYEGADHGLRVDKQVLPQFMDDLSGWVLGLPGTGTSGPVVAGAQPVQLYLAAPVPQPRWLGDGDVLVAIVMGAAGLIALPGVVVVGDRVVRGVVGTVRRRRRPGRPAPQGPRWPSGIAWRVAAVGAGVVATVVALVWYLVAIARIAMDYQHNALVVQGGWLLVRGLGIWVIVAIVLLARRMVDVRAKGGRIAPGIVRLAATWCIGLGTATLLVILAYWGVYQLGI
ncbi:alpha/beta hydrolase family protein [Cellulomonas sp. 73-92]|uniref:alpha/beta hydrolase family protein n=1 Tax=Cellulomonas sp. 73-92 TaxID=1895740 RepID=UPI00345DF403